MTKRTTGMTILLIVLTLLVCTISAIAQIPVKVDSKGNYYATKSVSHKDTTSIMTNKTYKDAKGIIYPVYKTSTGRLYIIRISRNTGLEYKQYLKV